MARLRLPALPRLLQRLLWQLGSGTVYIPIARQLNDNEQHIKRGSQPFQLGLRMPVL